MVRDEDVRESREAQALSGAPVITRVRQVRRVPLVRHASRSALVLIALLASAPFGAASAGQAPSATAHATLRVRKVIDGDTITVSGIGTVRLLGVDAPEKAGGYRPSEPYGDEATRFMKSLLDGKLVRLEYDGERKDPYDRTLAYVYLEDGTLANEAIIRAGLAETYRRFTYRLKPQFQAAEKEARDAHRGMWVDRRR
jgi:micrococcal nuclease